MSNTKETKKFIPSTEPDCAFDYATDIISKKWNINLILELITHGDDNDDSLSFSEIHERIPGISPRMLSMRLKFLTKKGIIEQFLKHPDKTKKKRYRLTESGIHLSYALKHLREWSLKFGDCENEKCQNNECKHGLAINRLIQLELE